MTMADDRRAEALERLDDWQRDAEECDGEAWRYERRGGVGYLAADSGKVALQILPCDAIHAANFGPDVALRLIAGLRAVLERHVEATDAWLQPNGECDWCAEDWPCDASHDAKPLIDAILGPGAEGTHEHEPDYFDRTICANCNGMHYVCKCGSTYDPCAEGMDYDDPSDWSHLAMAKGDALLWAVFMKQAEDDSD